MSADGQWREELDRGYIDRDESERKYLLYEKIDLNTYDHFPKVIARDIKIYSSKIRIQNRKNSDRHINPTSFQINLLNIQAEVRKMETARINIDR